MKKYVKEKRKSIHIFCMDASYGFKKILEKKPKSIILTFGALAHFHMLENELKIKIKITLEDNHVINKEQINFNIISHSINELHKLFSIISENKKDTEMIKSLGITLLEIIKLNEEGILIFFPSYSFLDNFYNLWNKEEIIKSIEEYKKVFKDSKKDSKNKNKLLYDFQNCYII